MWSGFLCVCRRTEDGKKKKNHLKVKDIQASSSPPPSHFPHIASMHHQRWLALQAAVSLREGRVCFSPSHLCKAFLCLSGIATILAIKPHCRKTKIYMIVSWVLTTLLQPSTADLLSHLTSRLSLYSYRKLGTSTLL